MSDFHVHSDFEQGGAGQGAPHRPRHVARYVLIGVCALAVLFILSQSLYIVGEAEQAVVSRFGVIRDIVVAPDNDFHERYPNLYDDKRISLDSINVKHSTGLMLKLPFVDKVEKISDRLFTYVSDSEVVNTSEKKQYYITTYAQYQIADPALYSLSFSNASRAELYLDNLIHPIIVQSINRLNAEDFVSNKDRLNEALAQGLRQINEDVCISGIEVVDLQIHRTILPPANIESTYARMTADRTKVAQLLRSEGEEAYNKAVADADLEAHRLEADAVAQAGEIRGQADAAAMEIYAEAYQLDPAFYTYWRSLQALQTALEEGSTLVLTPDHPLFEGIVKYLK